MSPFVLLLLACDPGGLLPSSPEAPEAPAAPATPRPKLELTDMAQKPEPQVNRGTPSARRDAPEPAITAENCQDLDEGGPVAGPDCVTGVVACGQTVIGHTRGGVQRYDSRFYDKKRCTPALTNHDGGDERVYRLDVPAGEWTADVWLETPCADLDLAAMKHNGETCPTPDDSLRVCDMYPKPGDTTEYVKLVSQGKSGQSWYLVVEGKDDEEGAFALHIQCHEGLY